MEDKKYTYNYSVSNHVVYLTRFANGVKEETGIHCLCISDTSAYKTMWALNDARKKEGDYEPQK